MPALSLTRLARRGELGAAAVEFALVFPLFALVVMGAIDFGYYFYSEQVVTNAAREGARAGTLSPQGGSTAAQGAATSAASTAAQNYMQKGAIPCGTHVTPTYVTVGGSPAIDVVIDCPFTSLTGFTSLLVPSHLYSHAVMRWQ